MATNDESSESELNEDMYDKIDVPMRTIKVFKKHVPVLPVPRASSVKENVGSLRNMDLDSFMQRYAQNTEKTQPIF